MSTNFEKLSMGIGATIIGIAGIAFFAFFGGTLVWLLWPVAIPAALPGIVKAGYLAPELLWWQSVCLTWLCGLLIKSKAAITSKKEK